MDRNAIIREWFYRLPKGYAEAPYSKEEMKKLTPKKANEIIKNILE